MRPRVALIVTGRVEFLALHRSLGRAFPGIEFVQHASPPGAPMNGFTSRTLDEETPVLEAASRAGAVTLSSLAKLVDQLILAVDPGRNGAPHDYAVLLDDVELCNAHQPGRVVDHVRQAVKSRLDAQWPSADRRARAREKVRERCSFHLLCPMVESYFFGDDPALDRAGRVGGRASAFDPATRDLEDFEVDDAVYRDVPPSDRKGDWRHSPEQRARHPKKYVSYLADPRCDGATSYREATTGAAALEALDWASVLARPAHARYARSLLADLARIAAPTANALRITDADCAPLTARFGARDRTLRNL